MVDVYLLHVVQFAMLFPVGRTEICNYAVPST